MENLSFHFAFLFSSAAAEFPWLSVHIPMGDGVLSLNAGTPYRSEQNGENKLVLYGYAQDVMEQDDWCRKTMRLAQKAEDVFERTEQLGGKYILFLEWQGKVWCMGDATGSAPVFWHEDGRSASYIPLLEPLEEDPEKKEIRLSGSFYQPMPYDITQYKHIKQLLPNHALDIKERRAERIIFHEQESVLSANEAAARTAPMILKILGMYHDVFVLNCPVTSGKDSRIVLAAMNKLLGKRNFPCFTMKLDSLSSFDPQDVCIPEQMGRNGWICHSTIAEEQMPEKVMEEVDKVLGWGNYSTETAMIAWTICTHLKGNAILNGDIMGQIGKCSLHRGVPEILANPGYFRCKLHNFSTKAKKYMHMWMMDVRHSQEWMNIFDLFSVENRLGRWAAQENQMYDLLGVPYFNLFNCRKIIGIFSAVPRKVRADGKMHEALLKELDESLLHSPYGNDKLYERVAKSHWMFYWLATWSKYVLGWGKFKLTKGFTKS